MKLGVCGKLFLVAITLLLLASPMNSLLAATTSRGAAEEVVLKISGADIELFNKDPQTFIKNRLIAMGYKVNKVNLTTSKAWTAPGIKEISVRCKCCSLCKDPRGNWYCCEWCCE